MGAVGKEYADRSFSFFSKHDRENCSGASPAPLFVVFVTVLNAKGAVDLFGEHDRC